LRPPAPCRGRFSFPDIAMTTDALSPKEQRFVVEFLKDHNGTQAAKRAGYSAKTARVIAQKLLARPRVQQALQAKMQKVTAKAELSAQRVLEELKRVALVDPRRFIEWDSTGVRVKASSEISEEDAAALSEIEVKIGEDGAVQVKVKTHSKLDALDKLAKHFRLFKEEPEAEAQRLVLSLEWPDGTPMPARMKKLQGG
jgi:phage terminase small subunit